MTLNGKVGKYLEFTKRVRMVVMPIMIYIVQHWCLWRIPASVYCSHHDTTYRVLYTLVQTCCILYFLYFLLYSATCLYPGSVVGRGVRPGCHCVHTSLRYINSLTTLFLMPSPSPAPSSQTSCPDTSGCGITLFLDVLLVLLVEVRRFSLILIHE